MKTTEHSYTCYQNQQPLEANKDRLHQIICSLCKVHDVFSTQQSYLVTSDDPQDDRFYESPYQLISIVTTCNDILIELADSFSSYGNYQVIPFDNDCVQMEQINSKHFVVRMQCQDPSDNSEVTTKIYLFRLSTKQELSGG